jgi:hypothetical protein
MVGLLFKTKQNRKTTPSKKRSGMGKNSASDLGHEKLLLLELLFACCVGVVGFYQVFEEILGEGWQTRADLTKCGREEMLINVFFINN